MAQGHRLTKKNWSYQNVSLSLSDPAAVMKRLTALYQGLSAKCSFPECLVKGDVVYLSLKLAGGYEGTPRYQEFALRLRRGRARYKLAFGNSLVRLRGGRRRTGFVNLHLSGQTMQFLCSEEFGRRNMDFRSNQVQAAWSRELTMNDNKPARGQAFFYSGKVGVEVDLEFPSILDEDSAFPKIYIRQQDEVIAEVLKGGLNPMFAKGYRLGLWFKDEIPIIYPKCTIPIASPLFNGVIVAAVGTICHEIPPF